VSNEVDAIRCGYCKIPLATSQQDVSVFATRWDRSVWFSRALAGRMGPVWEDRSQHCVAFVALSAQA
jgi:hypothetical protein